VKAECRAVALAVRVVEAKPGFRTLRALFVEYEADLPSHLRHGAVPELVELVKVYSGRNRAFLALANGTVVGCVAMRKCDPETALLLRLYVKPERRPRCGAIARRSHDQIRANVWISPRRSRHEQSCA
jgi:hypothetical protein